MVSCAAAREYLPVEDDRNPFARDPLAADYAAFVTTELVPFIAREYRSDAVPHRRRLADRRTVPSPRCIPR